MTADPTRVKGVVSWLPRALFGGGIAIIGSIAILSHTRITTQQEDAYWVTHTHQVLEGIESVRTSVARLEASRRALVITGETPFRDALSSHEKDLREGIEKLKQLTADNRGQQARIEQLLPLIDRRIAQIEEFSAAATVDPATQRERVHRGIALSGQILTVLGDMESTEKGRLKERSEAARKSVRRTQIVSISGGLAGMTVFALGLWSFLQESRRRRRAEESLREANFRLEAADLQLQAFFDTSLELTAIADLDGYFKKINPSWERVLGWPAKEILAHPWLDFVHPDDREPTVRAAEQLASGAAVVHFENRYRCKDGSYRWLSWSVPAPAAGSSTLYCTAMDVTELKRAEENLKAANEDLMSTILQCSFALQSPMMIPN